MKRSNRIKNSALDAVTQRKPILKANKHNMSTRLLAESL